MEEANETPGRYDDYKPGSKDSFGVTIKTVIGRHAHMVVYITDTGVVGWNYHHLPERLRPAVTEFQTLNALADSCISKKLREVTTGLLARGLYAGFLSAEGQDPTEKFADAKAFILDRATGRARLRYVLWSLLSAFALGLLMLGSSRWVTISTILVGVEGGLIGALISIIQRGSKLSVDPLGSASYLAFQGFVRIVLGGIFGTFLVVASKANVVLGNISGDSWALFSFSIAAGFSERFVPDILKHSLDRVT